MSGALLWLGYYDVFILPTDIAIAMAQRGWPGLGIALDVSGSIFPQCVGLGALVGLLARDIQPLVLATSAVVWPAAAIALHLGARLGGPADPDAPTPLWSVPRDSIGVAILTSITLALVAVAGARIRTLVRSERA